MNVGQDGAIAGRKRMKISIGLHSLILFMLGNKYYDNIGSEFTW